LPGDWPDACNYGRMDMSSLPGFAPFLDPVALAIVGGGTVLAVVLRTPFADLRGSLAALRVLGRRPFAAEPLIEQIEALSRIARRHGVIALDRAVIQDPDIAAAASAIVDGASPGQVATLVEHRRAARLERHRAAGEVWASAAEAGPAMGMVGTLIGLVQMFTAMRDPATIGTAMAVALLTTLYGAVLASLVALPVAARLKRLARHEAQERARLQAPLAALAAIEPARRPLREVAA
jgi:chemotaxis protein MotA